MFILSKHTEDHGTGKGDVESQGSFPVQASGLRKSYGNTVALDSIDISVRDGELFGIIGPDGAGKTTLFRILTTLIIADDGKASVNGYDVVEEYAEIRRNVGYMPGKFSLYQDMSVEENLNFFAAVFGTTPEDNYHLISDIYSHIEPFRKRRAGQLSGGMKQKLALCCALIHKPEILFLDEPTTGVDAVSRKEFWGMLRRLQSQGLTIVVSTPYMDEAKLCDRIALIKNGRFIGVDTPDNIIAGFGRPLWSAKGKDMFALLGGLRSFPLVDNCYVAGGAHHFTVKDGFTESGLMGFLGELGHEDIRLAEISPDIEDCYMQLANS